MTRPAMVKPGNGGLRTARTRPSFPYQPPDGIGQRPDADTC